MLVGLVAIHSGLMAGIANVDDEDQGPPLQFEHFMAKPSPAPPALDRHERERARAALEKLPLYFVANEGQTDARVAYYVQGSTTSVYLTRESVVFTLSKPLDSRQGFARPEAVPTSSETERWVVRLSFEGANPDVKIVGRDRTDAVVSYFSGAPSQWKTGLPTFGTVVYEELWPGIDLVYGGRSGRLKYTFVVKPGADPARIRLRYEGATTVRMTEAARLRVETPVGGFEEDAPYAYQGKGEHREEVVAEFMLEEGSGGDAYRFGFRVGDYDRSKVLVLDPVVLAYSGYIGGSGIDDAWGVAVDASGNAYVVGRTQSSQATFPVAVGPDVTYSGGAPPDDAFVAKVDPSGTSLVYCGYMGGTLFDIAYEVAVDSSGAAYVVGTAVSTQSSFPVTVGPDLTHNGGAGLPDAFVAKVNPGGTALVYSGYIGGSGTDEAFSVAVDSSGAAYVTGTTDSSAATFPETVGPDLTPNGGTDGWVGKVNPAGTGLDYCGYLGGSGTELLNAIAVDGSGNAYIGGRTDSTEAQGFPLVGGPDLTYNGGALDGTVTKVDATGASFVYSGYIGGTGVEEVTGIAVDASSNVYLSGTTGSTEASFPVTVGPDVTYNGGTLDGFVAKLDPTGAAYVYSGYIGGSGADRARDIDIDPFGGAFVVGLTTSTEATFPVLQGPDLTYNGGANDAYIARTEAAGTALTYCGYIGGSGDDQALGVAVDGSRNAYVIGSTASSEATFPASVGPDVVYNGGGDAFVAKVEMPRTNYRSIGTASDYSLGTVTATQGSPVVTGSGAQMWQAANRGVGDRIDIGGTDYTILAVTSQTALTLTSAFTGTTGSYPYTISRQHGTIASWEDCVDGPPGGVCTFFPVASTSLIADNRREVGVAYNDGIFQPASPVQIDGATTDAVHNITLTVAGGNRHNGTPGTGVIYQGLGTADNGLWVATPYTKVEWIEFRQVRGALNIAAIRVFRSVAPQGENIVLSHLLIHDFLDTGAGNAVMGIRLSGGATGKSATVRNTMVWDGDRYGIQADAAGDTLVIENCSVDHMDTTDLANGIGIFAEDSTVTVINTISTSNPGGDFAVNLGSFSASSTNNTSFDGSAPGSNPQTAAASALFVSPNADLHLKSGGNPAVDTATTLSPAFLDIDGGTRTIVVNWDRGADEREVTTEVELVSFTATPFDGAVSLTWQTASELDNLGFHIHRALTPEGPYEQITSRPIPGLGSSPVGASYSHVDSGLTNGSTYYYKLEDIETTGATEFHGPVWATPSASASGSAGNPGSGGSSSNPRSSSTRITYGDPAANSLRVLKRSPRQVVLELVTEGFYAEPQDDGSVTITVPDFMALEEAGSPSIPVRRSWVEAIAGRKVELAWVAAREVEAFTGLRPSNAEVAELVATPHGTVLAARRRARKAFRGAGLYPSSAARMVDVAFQGDSKKALVELAPLRWDESRRQLLLARRLVVRLWFGEREPTELSTDGVRGRRYRGKPSHDQRTVVARLGTTDRGLHRVRYEEVMEGGRGVPAESLRLSRQGEPVAHRLEPNGTRFRPGSVLYFVSEGAVANPFGNEAVYELEVVRSREAGEAMATVSAAPSGEPQASYWHRAAWEEDRYYQAALIEAPDLWLWDLLFAPETKSYPIQVSALAPRTSEASKLSVWLQGASDFPAAPDHHVRVYVNGSLVEEVSWDGTQAKRLDIELAPGLLRNGDSVLELENVGDTGASYSMVMLDRYQVEYPRLAQAADGRLEGRWSAPGRAELSGFAAGTHVLDVSGAKPRWLVGTEVGPDGVLRFRAEGGRSYLAVSPEAVYHPMVTKPRASQVKATNNRADYLVIGPEAFLNAATPLLELRQSQGLKVKAVSIEEISSEFGFGEPTPEALKDFLSYAYHHWTQPSPRYVVLLGDATYDFKDRLQTGVTNQVPPLMVKTSYLWTASDPSYAAVNGDDIFPDLVIGRLPAAALEEARSMVEKIVAYETGDAGLAAAPVVLVADNPDRAGNFVADADQIALRIRGRPVHKIYLTELGPTAVRASILEAFDEGASLISYVGHGGIHLWASENVFNIWDIPALRAQSQQPLLLTMNCLNGYFHFPYFDSLAEELVRARDKGAIAAFSPSGLSQNGPANRYHEALLSELFEGHHERLGDAVMAAQETYAASGALPELLSIYHLLGDPALKLK